MRKLVIVLAVLLAVLHQDFWLWDNTSLLFGFLPVGLGYHALYSVAAACLAMLAVKYWWPQEAEEGAE